MTNTPKPFDAAAYAAVALPALDLAIDLAWMANVVANLQRTAELAELFLSFPLGDEDEAAPIFVP